MAKNLIEPAFAGVLCPQLNHFANFIRMNHVNPSLKECVTCWPNTPVVSISITRQVFFAAR
jgi:hypothetical protein